MTQDRSSGKLTSFVLLVTLLAAVAGGAVGMRQRAWDRRIASRVDSLVLAVTALRDRMAMGTSRTRMESTTVSMGDAPSLGADSAPVTVIEFTDYECPFCRRFALTTEPQIRRRYVASGAVRFTIRNLPLSIHPHARALAVAATCATEQGASAFWRFHDGLFEASARSDDSLALIVAREQHLDMPRLKACVHSLRPGRRIAEDIHEARNADLTGTPSFIVGVRTARDSLHGVIVRGAVPIATFERVIDSALSQSRSLRPE
jgi:protein-disulfide isomerase